MADQNTLVQVEATTPAYDCLVPGQPPKVSVVVPSYNHEKYIGETLQSVLRQSYQDFEIVINDDMSRDGSVEIIKAFLASNEEIPTKFLRHTHNQGGVITLNHLIENSQGDYIALINSDDTWRPGKLQQQVEYLDQHPEIGAVFTQAVVVNDRGVRIELLEDFLVDIFIQKNRSRGMWLRRLFFELNCLCHPSMLIRRSVYTKIGLYDPRYRQLPDMQMWVRLLKYTNIHIIESPLVFLRYHATNTSILSNANGIRNVNELNMIMREFFNDVPEELLKEGFGDLFKKQDASTPDEIACEKAFLYFTYEFFLRSLYENIGIEKIYHLLGQPVTREILVRSYQFDFAQFLELTGKSFYEGSPVSIVASSQNSPNDSLQNWVTSDKQTPLEFLRRLIIASRHLTALYFSKRSPDGFKKILRLWMGIKGNPE